MPESGGGGSASRPVAAVIAVTLRGDEVVLVRRSYRPNAGLWGFPGGKVKFGEPVLSAAERELGEETGVDGRSVTAFDAADVIGDGTRPSYHYLLVAVLVEWIHGEPVADDDVEEAAWFRIDALPSDRSPDVLRIAKAARDVAARTIS